MKLKNLFLSITLLVSFTNAKAMNNDQNNNHPIAKFFAKYCKVAAIAQNNLNAINILNTAFENVLNELEYTAQQFIQATTNSVQIINQIIPQQPQLNNVQLSQTLTNASEQELTDTSNWFQTNNNAILQGTFTIFLNIISHQEVQIAFDTIINLQNNTNNDQNNQE